MIHWKYNMLHTSKKLRHLKQITKLNRFHNCLIDGDIVELQSLSIWFDQINDIIPTKLEFYDGKVKSSYTDLNIIKIVDNEDLNKTYDSDNAFLLHYEDPYVKKFRNLIKNTKTLKSLVDRYIIDWSFNNSLINKLKIANSEYIELNYYIYF